MNRLLLVTALFLTGCFEPVDVGTNDAGSDGGVSPCVVGMDQTCNELATMSALAGTCSTTGCSCSAGFERGPTGKCRPLNACPSAPQQPGGACTIAGITCRYGYAPVECGGRTVRCDTNTWVEVEHSDPQQSCNRDGGCSGSAPYLCVAGDVGGLCGDGANLPVCQGNTWVCRQGTIPNTQCACSGLRPGCTCTAQGWSCADSGPASDSGRPLGRDVNGEVLLPDGGICSALGAGPSSGGCCPGLTNNEFSNDDSCRVATCQPLNAACGSTSCCPGLTCTAGRCVASEACTPAGGLCAPNALDTCCAGALCVIDWLDVPRCFQRPPDWLCGPYVLSAASAACRTEADCCAQSCDAGRCVGPLR